MMSFSKPFKNYILILIIVVVAFFIFMVMTKSTYSSPLKSHWELPVGDLLQEVALSQETLNEKIDPEVWQALDKSVNGETRIIVYMAEQANLTEILAISSSGNNPENINVQNERKRDVFDALTQFADKTQGTVLDHLKESKSSSTNTVAYWIFNGFTTMADKKTVLGLASLPEVGHIYLDKVIQLSPVETSMVEDDGQDTNSNSISWGISKIQSDQVWQQLGYKGNGVVVGSIDTGVQWDHPALKNKYRGWDGETADHTYSWFDAVNHQSYPYDDQGHGTHAMGIIVGDDNAGNQIGVAPGAKWIAVKALDSSGGGMISDLLEAMQWMLAPGGDPLKAPNVVNNSWGSPVCEKTFMTAVQAWRAAGIIPVFAGGNGGVKGDGSIGSPGCYPEAIAVGATDSEDQIAAFSSRGPSIFGEIKPNVTAPGVDIRSSLNTCGYGYISGTSMAAPHVTGVIALMLSANPTLSIEEVERALEESAVDLGDTGQDNIYGWGRVNALDAINFTPKRATIITGVFDDSDPGIIYTGAWVQIDDCEFCYLGDQYLSKELYSSARFTFDGEGITLVNTYAPIFGEIRVVIDDQIEDFINLNSADVQWQKPWSSQKLPPGQHTLAIIHYSGQAINLDGILVSGESPMDTTNWHE